MSLDWGILLIIAALFAGLAVGCGATLYTLGFFLFKRSKP